MTVTTKSFGKTKSGKEVTLYTLENSKGTKAVLSSLGADLVSLFVKNDKGELKDVVLGYETLEDYEANPAFLGCVVGPCANRIANGKCTIEGVEYNVIKNDGENNLHTDYEKGLHKQVWNAEPLENGVKFSCEMPDLYVGLPGNIKVSATYTLNDDNELKIQYEGQSDKATIFNLTNHSYYNLAGHDAGQKYVYDTDLIINASKYTEIKPGAIPTGKLVDVAGTPLDFTKVKKIGKEVCSDWEQMTMVKGYDHNMAIDNYDGKLKKVAQASCDGRTMEVYTDLPGIQFYSGNWLIDVKGKKGVKYDERGGFCLETQFFPNSVNEKSFVSPVKKAGEKYTSVTMLKFI